MFLIFFLLLGSLLLTRPNQAAVTPPSNAVALDRTAPGLYRRINASWQMQIATGGEGESFVLLNTQNQGVRGAAPAGISWDNPRLSGAFGVAFDVRDPPTQNPFDADGNIYGRPQREVALYWDGTEIVRRVSPVEFRGKRPLPVGVTIAFVCGGANVTIRIAGVPVYANYFIPGMMPYESRAAFTRAISHVAIAWREPIAAPPPPRVVPVLDQQILDIAHNRQSSIAAFPDDTASYGRIICTLTLSKPDKGYDPWDRQAAIYAYDDSGERFELLRFITPYHRGYTWNVDVSDYRPLLRGHRKIEAWCETYSTGWKASVTFTFYSGRADRVAYKVLNLWHGQPEIGDPDKPVTAFFTPQTLTRGPEADFVKLRFTVTGHGQAPNTDDAAEFLPLRRAVSVNGVNFSSLLWKTDNYLNPCSPQGGTWKFDRAGWGPGDVVAPWDIEATPWMPRGQASVIRYQIAPFLNKTPDHGNPARHWIESQAIFYRKG